MVRTILKRSSLYAPPLFALLISTFLYGGALVAQFGFGLPPCEMCYWQRWPHQAAILLSTAALASLYWQRRQALGKVNRAAIAVPILTILAALAIATSGAIGVFHAGVEYGWWQGLTRCAMPDALTSGADVTAADIFAMPIVRCDTAPWQWAGISLAGFNALFSLAGAGAIGYLLIINKARTHRNSNLDSGLDSNLDKR